ncbi:MAG: FeGP cofactor biosynthesis protein HcgF family protein [Methanobrevibacter sp.]|nr:FeGP cofactor biosynthesis protein HcgF family protein [Methanobrevibacter sp.]
MIKIATAECFTHGKIGRELHAIAQNYDGKFGKDYIENLEKYGNFDYAQLSVTCSLFIPTIEAVKKILNVENPPKPKKLIKGIKVYDEKGDLEVSKIMAEAVKKLSDCDIAIGTTAGIGRGGIAIITDEYEIITTTDTYADLNELDSEDLFNRSEDGIKKTLEILLLFLNNNFDKIKTLENVKIIKK